MSQKNIKNYLNELNKYFFLATKINCTSIYYILKGKNNLKYSISFTKLLENFVFI